MAIWSFKRFPSETVLPCSSIHQLLLFNLFSSICSTISVPKSYSTQLDQSRALISEQSRPPRQDNTVQIIRKTFIFNCQSDRFRFSGFGFRSRFYFHPRHAGNKYNTTRRMPRDGVPWKRTRQICSWFVQTQKAAIRQRAKPRAEAKCSSFSRRVRGTSQRVSLPVNPRHAIC